MPHFKSAFAGKFLNASEIDPKGYDAVIHTVRFENVGGADNPERKLVAFFKDDAHKAIVLNQTRCEAIAELVGTPDYEAWAGTPVHISQGSTRFNGARVPCIVIGEPAIPF